MKRNFKYLLKPNSAQAATIDRWMESLRLLYNFGLTDRREAYKAGNPIGYYQQADDLKSKKAKFPRYAEVHSQVLQQCLMQLERSFKNFFEKKSKYPRYKAAECCPSICFPQNVKIDVNTIVFPKLGKVRAKLHRQIPADATLKQGRIVREAGRYYVVLSLDLPEPTVLVPPVNVVGCDVGVKHLATFSDGTVLDGEQPLKKGLARLKKAQKRLRRKKTKSKNKSKQRIKIQKIHRKITNQRHDFLHKESVRLAQTYDAIVFEDMNLRFINRNKTYKTSRKSYDIGIGTFRSYCEYKFAERGKQVFHVNPKNTTQECSVCGHLVPKEIEDRVHLCPFCGLKMDRDLNAAINIRNRIKLGQELPDSMLVEEDTSTSAYVEASVLL